MKATISVYDSHKKAINAIEKLAKNGYPVNKLSLIGKADLIDDHMHVKSHELLKEAPVSVGVILGPILGVLTGVGVVAIPGLGFILGAGAILGALAGFDVGLVSGGIISLLMTLGLSDKIAVKYHEHLKLNRFIVIAQGNKFELEKARAILEAHGMHHELLCH